MISGITLCVVLNVNTSHSQLHNLENLSKELTKPVLSHKDENLFCQDKKVLISILVQDYQNNKIADVENESAQYVVCY